ncbi:MAG: DUF7507 domain-containing protein [Clostridium sp.]|uniref:DUF7507 domain-containing protein n=1 Tax=Clostridium sp. TaxID=1506 RepID=UPI003F371FEA
MDPSLPLEADSAESNLVITKLNNADLTITKQVDKKGADLQDVLLYTLVVKNLGNTNANEVVIKDTIPNGTEFIKNSVTVDNIPQPGVDPQVGIPVSNIPADGVVTITFNVQIVTLPTVNPIPNDANVAYKYTVDPSIVNGKASGALSNVVTVPVSHAELANIKGVDRNFATVGDNVEYTLTLSNSGNVDATNVILYDTIPKDTVFIVDSVVVDGVNKPGVNPESGIQIGTIKPSQQVQIKFKISITTIPSINPVPNNARVSYNYTVENVGTKSINKETNFVNTRVNDADVAGIKSVDKKYANVNDEITYTITLINSGNIKADNMIFYDTIPGDTTFKANSLTVGGNVQSGVNPQTGVSISPLGPGQSVTISYKVIVNTIPAINPIPNSGFANYDFVVDEQTGLTKKEGLSTNIVYTTISKAILETFKYASKEYADVGEEVTYTIVFKNKGNVPSEDTLFIDTIPNDATFVENSVTLNNAILNGANPQSGISIGKVLPNQNQTITFRIKINTIPNPNPIVNSGATKYAYTVDPSMAGANKNEVLTNAVNTQVNRAILERVKVVDKAYGVIGEELSYSIGIRNTGNTDANNIIVTDTIPKDTSFIQGSVTINGISKGNANPEAGINVGNLKPSEIVTVSFKVKVLTIPNPNPILNTGVIGFDYTVNPSNPNGKSDKVLTNEVSTQISEAIIRNEDGGLIKFVDKDYADITEEITYTVNLKNTGNVDAVNVTVFDTIPEEVQFVKDSVEINGGLAPGENPLTGIYVGTIKPSEESIVTFKVKVMKLPLENPIRNTAEVAYNFTSDKNKPLSQSRRYRSNTVTTNILSAIIINEDGGLVKRVDSKFAAVGDIVTYTVDLKNTGNTDAENVTINDVAPEGTEFVENSFIVDGSTKIGVNPADGYNLGKIVAGGTVTVEFKVKVLEIPVENPFKNIAEISYIYTSDPKNPNDRSRRSFSNIVDTFVKEAIIKNEDGGLVKTVDKKYAIIGDAITYTIKLKNTGNTVAENIFVRDTIPKDTEFIAGSVTVDGMPAIGTPESGIEVGFLDVSEEKNVIFKVRVTTLPDPNPILNDAIVYYNFTSNPIYPNANERGYTSNTVDTKVNIAKIDNSDGGLIKKADKEFVKVNDVITYTVELKNTGNVDAINVLFKDSIQDGLVFVKDSVEIDKVKKLGYNPTTGFMVGNIAVNEVKNVSFKVIVSTIPKINPVLNMAEVGFEYIFNPNTGEKNGGMGTSNIVETKVNQAYIRNEDGGLVKSVSDEYASIGDEVTYTIKLKNTGNVTATGLKITDTIPKDTVFVKNSVKVNGIGSNENPELGIKVDDLDPGQESTVQFKILITTIPKINPIENSAKISYRFTKDPNIPNGEFEEHSSNIVKTQINEARIQNADGGLIKSVDKEFADINEIVTYTIKLKNTGNVKADNVILFDTLPEGLEFVEDSAIVNGFNAPGQTPGTGIVVGTVGVLTTVIVSFKVKVISIPKNNPTKNTIDVSYTFVENPKTGGTESRRNTSNPVTVQINHAEISQNSGGLKKEVNKNFADVNEEITYKVILKNTGNVKASNVVVRDTIPSGTKFIQNSVFINGENKLAVNPENGVFVNSIEPNETVEVTFKVVAPSLPDINPVPNEGKVSYTYTVNPEMIDGVFAENMSNKVFTKINTADFSKENGGIFKVGDKEYADINDEILYKVVLTNKGNVSATSVILTDTLPSSVEFVKDSIEVNGVVLSGVKPGQGMSIGVVNPNEVVTITFKVTVISIPDDNKIENFAKVKYYYTKDPAFPNGQSKENESNVFVTEINNANISKDDGGFVKLVSKEYADLEDILTYTFFLKNTGNTVATSTILRDTVPNGMAFIENSATVNGVVKPGLSPEVGIFVGDVKPNEIVTVSFNVKVVSIPSPNPAKNVANVTYRYTVNPNRPNGKEVTNESNEENVKVNHGEISNEQGGLIKTSDKKYVKIGDTITYKIYMKNTGNVNTDNVVLQDTIPEGTELIPGSVLLNGKSLLGANPQVGVNIGTVKPDEEANLIFKVLVVSIADKDLPPTINGLPCPSAMGQGGLLENKARVCYRYTVEPSKPCGVSKCNETNVDKIKINTAIVSIKKETNPVFVDLDDEITFTLKLKNTGNVLGEEILLKDILDPALKFVVNSVKINGVSQPGVSITSGISIAPLQPEEDTLVEFKAIVFKAPEKNEIQNSATVTYNFQLNPENGEKGYGSDKSNVTNNYVNYGNIFAIKEVDKEYATGGEELTYKITMVNEGNTRVNNVELYDTVPEGTVLKQGSVILNGVPKLGAIPQYGIFIGAMEPGEESYLSYKVVIDKDIKAKEIHNTAKLDYQYTVNPEVTNGKSKETDTNVAITKINDAIISAETGSFTKEASKDFVDVGEKFTYTILAKNIGTVSANNVIIKDILQSNIEYVKGTLQINGVPVPDSNLQLGIPVGVIEPSKAVTVKFDVVVISVPSDGKIENKSKIEYSFIKNPEIPIEVFKEEYTSDSVVTVQSGFISDLVKSADKTYCKLGDIVRFKVVGKNTGNISLKDVLVKDELAPEYEFIKDSITVNSSLRLGEDIEKGVIIPNLPIGKEFKVEFKAKIVGVPKVQKLSNISTVSYAYEINGSLVKKQGETNEAFVNVREAVISYEAGGFEKMATKEFAQIGELISFYITVKNTGNVMANKVFIEDALPKELEFVKGSVEINSSSEPISNISEGITLGTVNPDEMMIIKFDAIVKDIPEDGKVSNEAFVKYSFIVDPEKPEINKQNKTNRVDIRINSIKLVFTKVAKPDYVAIGDVTNFEFEIANTGNIDANNVIFFDTVPKSMSFVKDSVVVNGIPIPGVDPTQGISIGNLAIDEDVKLVFKASVDEFYKTNILKNTAAMSYDSKINPNEAPIKGKIDSNEVDIIVRSPRITVTKESNYDTAIVGDVIHYSIKARNTGNIEVFNLLLVDLLQANLDFVENTVTVNGELIYKANPSKGVLIPKLQSTEEVLVEFDAIIIPSNFKTTKNKATAYYNYYVNPTKAPREGKVESNINVIDIENVDVTVHKSANKEVVVLDDVITYRVVVENCGSVQASNVEFVDSLPNTVEVVKGSFNVDGITINTVDIGEGVNIGSIAAKTKKTIEYSVKVKNVDCSGLVTNYAYALFNANISQDAPVRRVQATPSSLSIKAASPRFKELNVDKVLSIPCQKPDIEDINDVFATAEIKDFYVIKTMKGVSTEGKRLTGYKLVVNGVVSYTVEYTAAVPSQSVHSAHYCEKFSSYIIIDEESIPSPLANVVPEIEDVSWQMLDSRGVFANVTMNIVIK